ncbi:hypothetical protein BVC80_989g2 [Macleaya cordata]|uniref:Retrotransposon Copia-like N-terminal domain-containing protein n=1 Tax=Macleaya cordata TaxID=56857 RepID=A0A200PS39_MACCD|nr:hypothetical protein BVC80_989g2 [Macleaya cordata]
MADTTQTSPTSAATLSPSTPNTTDLDLSLPNLSNLTPLVSIKLDRLNYVLWESQMLLIFHAHNLYRYLDPLVPVPTPQILNSETNTLEPNPSYTHWYRVDQILLSWINATLTPPIFATVVGLRTARAVWAKLTATFASESTARALQLRFELQTIQKDNLSVTEYLNKIKLIVDSLASASCLLTDMEVVSNTLRGLGPDYDSFVTAIMTRSDLPSFSDLHGLLLHQEARIEYSYQRQLNSNPTSAFVARQQPQHNNHQSPNRSQSHRGGRGGRGGFRGGRGSRGGRGTPPPNKESCILTNGYRANE